LQKPKENKIKTGKRFKRETQRSVSETQRYSERQFVRAPMPQRKEQKQDKGNHPPLSNQAHSTQLNSPSLFYLYLYLLL
jgi:hypothetical protein